MSEHSSPRPRHQYRRPSCMLLRRDGTGHRLAWPSFGRVEGAARNSSAVLSRSGNEGAARGPRRERFGRGEKSGGPGLFFLVASERATNAEKRKKFKTPLAGRKMSPRRDARHSQADDDKRHHHHQNALFSK